MARVSEMFAVSGAAMHEMHELCRGVVAFFLGSEQLPPERWRRAGRVELRLRAPQGDHFRKGGVVTRVRRGPPCWVQGGGGGWI